MILLLFFFIKSFLSALSNTRRKIFVLWFFIWNMQRTPAWNFLFTWINTMAQKFSGEFYFSEFQKNKKFNKETSYIELNGVYFIGVCVCVCAFVHIVHS